MLPIYVDKQGSSLWKNTVVSYRVVECYGLHSKPDTAYLTPFPEWASLRGCHSNTESCST